MEITEMEEDIKQISSSFPIPKIIIDTQGKILSANAHIGEVFLYEVVQVYP